MKDFKSAFVDTAVFIYLLEDHPKYGGIVEKFFKNAYSNQAKLSTTVLSYHEFCVKPFQENRFELATTFLGFLQEANISLNAIDVNISDEAARLRAKYPSLKSVDSLQLAAAIKCQCDIFMTNDKRLKQVSEIKIVLVEEF
jgi:predicted nucleic acid-binding protein